jgi:hypothetical protein
MVLMTASIVVSSYLYGSELAIKNQWESHPEYKQYELLKSQ